MSDDFEVKMLKEIIKKDNEEINKLREVILDLKYKRRSRR